MSISTFFFYYFFSTYSMIQQHSFDHQHWSYQRSDKTLQFGTGKYAVEADGSITIQLGDNILLCTAVMNRNPDPETDFMPLTVDRRESFSAIGRIVGWAFRKREGRPSDNAVLYARLTDRSLRPLFPKWMINPTVTSISPLAVDLTQDLWVMSIVGCSLALHAAWIPFHWPVGAVRIGRKDGEFIINPTKEQIDTGEMNLLVAWPQWLINMIECDAHEVSDEILLEAFDLAQEHVNLSIDFQQQFLAWIWIKPLKASFNKPSATLLTHIRQILTDDKLEAMLEQRKNAFNDLFFEYESEALTLCKDNIEDSNNNDFSTSKVKMAVFGVVKEYIRQRTITTGVRLDGRDIHTIRPLFCEVGALPRVHWSGLFWRGETQVLTTCTLGSPSDHQKNDNMEQAGDIQTYMHHYNFPGFSTNEAKPTRGTGRREIGHGKLAEKSLEYMIPDKVDFPYTIRLVSECLGSGWSTSQASVCGSTLALMDAWVPIKKPVAGIAMGLMSNHDENELLTDYQILTDLKGTEDFTGDMDFKVAGTTEWVTAIQLDVKIRGLTPTIIKETITRAHQWRLDILAFMLQTIAEPRKELSPHAPKIYSFSINPTKIKEVIGKWGENIDKIIELAGGVKVDFEDDGTVFISDVDQTKIDKAVELIKDIAEDLPLMKDIEWTIARVEAYGVFVNLPRKKSWLVHVSKLWAVGGDLSTSFKEGDAITVQVTEVDKQWRLVLKKVL